MSAHGFLEGLSDDRSVLDAVEDHEFFVRRRSTDAATRRGLHVGIVTLGREELLFADPETLSDVVPSTNRSAILEMHSLRFIDSLRRDHQDEQDVQLWLRFVRGWARSADAEDAATWAFLPSSQRAVVIALGLRDFWPRPEDHPADVAELLERHSLLFTDKVREGRVHLLDETLIRAVAVMTQMSLPEERIHAFLTDFRRVYLTEALAPGGGIASTTTATYRWTEVLNVLESRYGTGTEPVLDVSNAVTDLWVHATRPDGSLVPAGGEDGRADWAKVSPVTPAARYAASQSDAGEAANDLLYVNPAGWAFGRSGWGETERDFHEETFVSLRYGPLESEDRHDDNTSLTFSARAVHWLDDNPGADTHKNVAQEWADRDHHSCVSINSRYRKHSAAELTRRRDTPQCFDLEVRDRAYLPVALTRRVVYSKSGDYLMVVDQSRSADPHRGQQNWIIPPDCSVRNSDQGVVLESGDAVCYMVWLNVPALEIHIEPLGRPGERGWTRIGVSFEERSARIITALVPAMRGEEVTCVRKPLDEGAISVIVTRPRHAEQLVITKEGAGTGGAEEHSETLAERIRNDALTGGMPPEAEQQLRGKIRESLNGIKRDLWDSIPTVERRRYALDSLRTLADDLGVRGLRDHGLGAAMIDIAGADLVDEVASHPLVSGRKRSGVISWDKQLPMQHQFYRAPIRTFRELSDDIDPQLERQMLTFDLGQLALPLFLSRISPGRTLNVMFHGATDRTRNAMPRFERLRSMESLGTGPTVFVSDPCLDLDASQILTWYIGHEELNLHRFLALEIDLLAHRLECDRVLYIGNSGGGFAALQVASYSAISGVVTFNPQIQIDNYVPRIVRTSQEVLFGEPSVAHIPELRPRIDAISRYEEIGFDKRVYFIQNTGDEMHHDRHYKPFRAAFDNSTHPENLEALTPYLGPGHRVPPPSEYVEHVLEGMRFVFKD